MRVGVTVPAVPMTTAPMTTVTVPPVPGSRPTVPGSAVLRCAVPGGTVPGSAVLRSAVLRSAVPGSGPAAARVSVPCGPTVALSVPAGHGARRLPVFRGVRG